MGDIELGLGLLSLGRVWGVGNVPPPSEADALRLISLALSRGIRFFDTAPAYARSEEYLGRALSSGSADFSNATIATKAGEHWREADETTYVDHSFDALCASLDNSFARLGRIDILQLHKSTEDVVGTVSVARFIAYAQGLGVREFGASVSSYASAERAIETGLFQWLQYPLNTDNGTFADLGECLQDHKMKAIINRPFAMGALATEGSASRIAAFGHLLNTGLPVGSIILSGTSSPVHLIENINNFGSAAFELDRLRNTGGDYPRSL